MSKEEGLEDDGDTCFPNPVIKAQTPRIPILPMVPLPCLFTSCPGRFRLPIDTLTG